MIRIVAAFAAAGLASAAMAQMAPEAAAAPMAASAAEAPMAASSPAALPHCSATVRDSCVQDERFASHSSMPGMHDNNAMHYKNSEMTRPRRR